MNRRLAALAGLLLFAPPLVSASARTRPEARATATIPLSIERPGARARRFHVEVARTEAEQARGLMFRRAMAADAGMVFPMNPPRLASFWMKNTYLPLDLLFISPSGRILNIAARAKPFSLEPITSDGPVSAVLELNGGTAERLGIRSGDRVRW